VLPPDPGALGFFRHLSDPHFGPVRVTAAALRCREQWRPAAAADPKEPTMTPRHQAEPRAPRPDAVDEPEVEGFVFDLDQYVQEMKRMSDQMQLVGQILDNQRAATATLVRNTR
jgi:hypothetical protein